MKVRSLFSKKDVISFVGTSWQIRMHVRLGGPTIQTGSDDLDNTLNRGSEIEEEKKRIKERGNESKKKEHQQNTKAENGERKSYTGAGSVD
jgi:hypothetical protein